MIVDAEHFRDENGEIVDTIVVLRIFDNFSAHTFCMDRMQARGLGRRLLELSEVKA